MVPTTAVGVYRTRDQVASAVDELRTNGFRSVDISVLFPDNTGTQAGIPERAASAPVSGVQATGALVGGTLEWLFGVRALMIPGAGPFIAAGPILDAIEAVTAHGGTGTLTGVLSALGLAPPNDERYDMRIRDGGILLAVRTSDSDWSRLARAIMARTSASDILTTGEDEDPAAIDRVTSRLTT